MRFKTDLNKEKTNKNKEALKEVTEVLVKADQNEETNPVVSETVSLDVKLTELALGVWRNEQKNTYHLVKMKYDPVAKVSGEVEVGEGMSLSEVGYYFRVMAGDTFL